MQIVEIPGVGKVEFPDGMSQDDMLGAIHKNFPELAPKKSPGVMSALGAGLSTFPDQVKTGVGGIMQSMGDQIGDVTIRYPQEEEAVYDESGNVVSGTERPAPDVVPNPAIDYGKRLVAKGQKGIAEKTPDLEKGSAAWIANQIGSSTGLMATAAMVTIATKSPMAGAAIIGGQVGGQQYAESRQRGRSSSEAMLDAAVIGGVEVVTERIPLGMLLNATGNVLTRIGKTASAEAIQEGVTEVTQSLYSAGVFDEAITPMELVENTAYAMLIGGIMGGGIAGVTAPLTMRDRVNSKLPQEMQIPDSLSEPEIDSQIAGDVKTPDDGMVPIDPELLKGDYGLKRESVLETPIPEQTDVQDGTAAASEIDTNIPEQVEIPGSESASIDTQPTPETKQGTVQPGKELHPKFIAELERAGHDVSTAQGLAKALADKKAVDNAIEMSLLEETESESETPPAAESKPKLAKKKPGKKKKRKPDLINPVLKPRETLDDETGEVVKEPTRAEEIEKVVKEQVQQAEQQDLVDAQKKTDGVTSGYSPEDPNGQEDIKPDKSEFINTQAERARQICSIPSPLLPGNFVSF